MMNPTMFLFIISNIFMPSSATCSSAPAPHHLLTSFQYRTRQTNHHHSLWDPCSCPSSPKSWLESRPSACGLELCTLSFRMDTSLLSFLLYFYIMHRISPVTLFILFLYLLFCFQLFFVFFPWQWGHCLFWRWADEGVWAPTPVVTWSASSSHMHVVVTHTILAAASIIAIGDTSGVSILVMRACFDSLTTVYLCLVWLSFIYITLALIFMCHITKSKARNSPCCLAITLEFQLTALSIL